MWAGQVSLKYWNHAVTHILIVSPLKVLFPVPSKPVAHYSFSELCFNILTIQKMSERQCVPVLHLYKLQMMRRTFCVKVYTFFFVFFFFVINLWRHARYMLWEWAKKQASISRKSHYNGSKTMARHREKWHRTLAATWQQTFDCSTAPSSLFLSAIIAKLEHVIVIPWVVRLYVEIIHEL